MFGWHVPAPNEALLVSGKKKQTDSTLPIKIVTGHGTFAMPIARRVSFLTLAMQEATVTEECVTQQGITLTVQAVIAFKVGDDPESIANAARRFLADQDQMTTLTGRIFAGHLRSIVGSMTVEDIIRERQKLAEEILDGSKTEMAKIGLTVDSLQIQSIDDRGSGYIAALAMPHTAAVNQLAASAQAQQEVLVEQAKVAERNAALREAQLVAEIVKPAQAEAERVRTLARADADRTKMSAEAASAEGRIALDQAIIAQLPQMIAAAAQGLSNANVTVLNGAEGLNATVASLASQGLAILHSITGGLAAQEAPEAAGGTRALDRAAARDHDAGADGTGSAGA